VEGDDDLIQMCLRASYPSGIAKMNNDDSFNSFKDSRDDSPRQGLLIGCDHFDMMVEPFILFQRICKF
jgi:hypothetical protein